MELTLISENKIKISLTKKDLDGYEISADSIDYDNTETRRVFWTLFDEAKKTTGFDAAKSRIFVQIYPGRDGGCELYVSKISGEKAYFDGELSARAVKRMVRRISEEDTQRESVYRFETLRDLISVCKRLKKSGYRGRSSAFYGDEDIFYLTVTDGETSLDFILEYGQAVSGEGTGAYLREHCKAICEKDAVERLYVL